MYRSVYNPGKKNYCLVFVGCNAILLINIQSILEENILHTLPYKIVFFMLGKGIWKWKQTLNFKKEITKWCWNLIEEISFEKMESGEKLAELSSFNGASPLFAYAYGKGEKGQRDICHAMGILPLIAWRNPE